MFTKFLMLSMFLATSQVFAGAESGGGGGVYKIAEGKYLTLPEVGILIGDGESGTSGKTYEKYYTIPEETKKELERILSKVNKFSPRNFLNLAIDKKVKFILKSDVDPAEYNSMKEEYRKALNSYGYDLDDEKFILPAYSTPADEKNLYGKTYILPDFLKLKPDQQAKILIHEHSMRQNLISENKIKKLVSILSLDVQINKLLNTGDASSFDSTLLIKYLVQTENMSAQDAGMNVLLSMQRKLGRPFFAEELTLSNVSREFELDTSLVQDLQEKNNLKENFAEILDGAQFVRTSFSSVGYQLVREELKNLCSKFGKRYEGKQIIYTSEESNEFLYSFKCMKSKNGYTFASDHTEYNISEAPLFFKK